MFDIDRGTAVSTRKVIIHGVDQLSCPVPEMHGMYGCMVFGKVLWDLYRR